VTDEGANVISGARVSFAVTEGGGLFQNGQTEIEAQTDSDGRASAHLTLGSLIGRDKQTVTSRLIDGPEGQEITAGFAASGFVPGDAANTTITGIVFDNQDNPLEGVTIRVDGTTRHGEGNEGCKFCDNGVLTDVSLSVSSSVVGVSPVIGEFDEYFPFLSFNTIEGVAELNLGAQTQLTITYQAVVGQRIELASGQNQTASIRETLPQPLILQVLDDNDVPVANKSVVFRVIQGSGSIGMEADLEGQAYLAQTDANGYAQTTFKLGLRSGNGNHKVRARVVGYDDEVVFYASATPNIGNKLSINSGNNQRGSVFQPLPAPFVVAVTDDGANVVANARVLFEVIKGGGLFQNGLTSLATLTDSDGRASAEMKLGSVTGLDRQTVLATLIDAADGEVITAGFSASGFVPSDPANTAITGLVFDNQDNPLEGVTIRVDGTTRQAIADAEGVFTILQAPVGPVHLIVDGSTALEPGEFPTLSYNLVTVSGVSNPMPAPIYMVKLNTNSAVYSGLQDVAITLDKVPGFKLEVLAGSVTFPDGSKEGYISVTTVNASKMPMVPPNGIQPQFVVTIQPTGARFDPPAPLTLPNTDGHPPGAQIEMFSYDHDLEEFVAIGLGTVNNEGTLLESNIGVGVIKAGWHGGTPPQGDGCASGPAVCGDYCMEPIPGCESECRPKPPSTLRAVQTGGNCRDETCGGNNVAEKINIQAGTGYLCEGQTKTFVANGNSNARTVYWSASDIDVLFIPAGANGDTVSVFGNRKGRSNVDATLVDGLMACNSDSASVDVWPVKAVDLDELNACPAGGVQSNRAIEIDGCSVDEGFLVDPIRAVLSELISGDLENTGQDRNDPVANYGGALVPTSFAVAACNQHDLCYQSCGSIQSDCEAAFGTSMFAMCAEAYPPGCPFRLPNGDFDVPMCNKFTEGRALCEFSAAVYEDVVGTFGFIFFADRQLEYCDCCQY